MRDNHPNWLWYAAIVLATSAALFAALPAPWALAITVALGSSGWSWGRRWLP